MEINYVAVGQLSTKPTILTLDGKGQSFQPKILMSTYSRILQSKMLRSVQSRSNISVTQLVVRQGCSLYSASLLIINLSNDCPTYLADRYVYTPTGLMYSRCIARSSFVTLATSFPVSAVRQVLPSIQKAVIEMEASQACDITATSFPPSRFRLVRTSLRTSPSKRDVLLPLAWLQLLRAALCPLYFCRRPETPTIVVL